MVTKVDAVVEAHKEGVGISGNNCEHVSHTVRYRMSVTIFRRSQLLVHISRYKRRKKRKTYGNMKYMLC